MNCERCAATVLGGASFCGVCGAPVAAPVRAQEAGGDTVRDRDVPEFVRAARRRRAASVSGRQDPYIGNTLNNRFLIEEKLGEGGFGAVYKGRQEATGRKVALKLLHPRMTRDDKVIERFRREGQVLCQLRDAHTITTYDFDSTEDGTLFIAMELLEGRSLHEVYHREAPIKWRRMVKIVSEMCSSLGEAHSLGIVHRDLKPENIYLEMRTGNAEFVKVLDFGIAKVVGGDLSGAMAQLTATGQTLGTLEYMSPEQLMGRTLDGRSDIYALGVVSYELITGQLPFPEAVGPAGLIAAQLRTDPMPPSEANPLGGIPDAVDQLILRMLGKRPDDRFADADALREACNLVLEESSDRPLRAADATPIPGTLAEPSAASATVPGPTVDDEAETHVRLPQQEGSKGLPGWALIVGCGVLGALLAYLVAMFVK